MFFLAKNPFITFEKEKIYEHVWQLMNVDGNNTVTVHIKSFRNKLRDTIFFYL
ncbi:helix-turn-helix domain-containing protein [Oceanobacillus sp. FSL K6-2867]|uniref:helix-turn-helix domain-containing protein n=1 Tax=Oceanobacillus sp. FSL K6-2867 TaxID=2954748 RepID=UPI0030DAA05A